MVEIFLFKQGDNMNEQDKLQPDYLREIFEAIAKADQEMSKYGIYLSWTFKLLPYPTMVTKSLTE